MSNITEEVLVPTTDTEKSKGIDYIRSKADELNYCYTNSDKMMRLSLGDNPNFSGARYLGDFTMTLEEAQAAKCDYVADMLGIKEGTRVIDLGCGWGGFLQHIKQKQKAVGVGVTLAVGQAKHCLETGLDVHCMDMREVYPDTFGPFDVATAFGSFEHLCSYEDYLEGKQMEIYRKFFDQVAELIPVGARFYMQTMTFGRKVVPRETWDINAHPSTDEYIMALMVKQFPKSWLPYMEQPTIDAAGHRFKLIDLSSGRMDYVETNVHWTAAYKKFNFRKYLLYASFIPKYIRDPEFRHQLSMLKYAPNQECFRRELFDHYRYVFERVK